MKKVLGSIALGLCLLAPVGQLYAGDHDHRDVHQWNDGENEAWHRYLKERRMKDHDWAKASKREQAAYWKWRDQHRDSH